MTRTLRGYQVEAIEAIEAKVAGGLVRPAVVLPTGAGKTTVFSAYAARPETRRRGRTIVVAHRAELVEQAAARVRDDGTGLRVGIVQGDVKQIGADVIVASVQTLRQPHVLARLRGIGTIVIDECHHAVASSYRTVLEHFGCLGPRGDHYWTPPVGGAIALGFTATLSRSDGAALGDIWQDVVYHRDIATMIAEGYLVRPRAVRVEIPELHLDRVRKNKGDYADGALGAALEGSLAPEKVAEAYIEHAGERQGVLFAPTVATAYAFAQALEELGVKTGVIHGALPKTERAARLEEFRTGSLQVLSNCMVLTEGTDLPMIGVVVVARPTKSRGLFVQMVGRGLRLHPDKDECLVLIVTDGSDAHQLVAPVELFGAEEKIKREKPDFDDDDELDPDALEDSAEEFVAEEPVYHRGPVAWTEVDLFASSASKWAQTYAGIWFARQGELLVCILPGPAAGSFDVISMHHATPGSGRWIQRGCWDLRHAMAYADDHVKGRGRGATPLDLMSKPMLLRQAERLHLSTAPTATLGELRAAVSVALASIRIDPGLPAYVTRGH